MLFKEIDIGQGTTLVVETGSAHIAPLNLITVQMYEALENVSI